MSLVNCTLGFIFCPKSSDSVFFTTHVSLICQIVFISLLIVATLTGNALLCYAIYKTSSRLTASSIFILNLAITDILVGTLVLPFWIFSTVSLAWPLPSGVCEFTGFLTMTLMQCSIFSLSGIAVDRYLNICHPLRYPIEATLTRVSFVVLGLWIFCLCIASFPIYGWGDYRFQPQTVPICNPEYISEVSFTIFLIVFGMALPFAIMLFSYIRIIQIARGHIRKIDALQTTLVNRTSPQQFLTVERATPPSESRSPQRIGHKPSLSKRFSKNVKAVRRVFIAVGVFFLCWGPYVIMNFWSVNNERIPIPYIADLLTTFLAFTNSSVNPVIFIILNRDLRRVVLKLGRRLLCCPAAAVVTSRDHSDIATYLGENEHSFAGNLTPNLQHVPRMSVVNVDAAASENNNSFGGKVIGGHPPRSGSERIRRTHGGTANGSTAVATRICGI